MDTRLIFLDFYMLRWSDIGNKQERIIGFALLVLSLFLLLFLLLVIVVAVLLYEVMIASSP